MNMQNLTINEMNILAQAPVIFEEVVVRPSRKRIKTIDEKINASFAEVASEINSYKISADEALREIHKTAYIWSKDEDVEIINEVITSYCPVNMPKKDIKSIIKNAISI